MLPFKLIYDRRYDLNLSAHVFPSQKYRLVHDALLEQRIAATDDFLAPEPAIDDDVLLVHGNEYVHKLKTGTLSNTEKMRLEIPWSREMVEACWLAAGGSILAGRRALADGCAANIGGGFHHAYPDHGEGFCAIHDVAVAIRRLQRDRVIETAMVIDTDVHHGNGTASIKYRCRSAGWSRRSRLPGIAGSECSARVPGIQARNYFLHRGRRPLPRRSARRSGAFARWTGAPRCHGFGLRARRPRAGGNHARRRLCTACRRYCPNSRRHDRSGARRCESRRTKNARLRSVRERDLEIATVSGEKLAQKTGQPHSRAAR